MGGKKGFVSNAARWRPRNPTTVELTFSDLGNVKGEAEEDVDDEESILSDLDDAAVLKLDLWEGGWIHEK